MKNYDLILTLIERAKNEMDKHTTAKAEHPNWHSGHKSKAIRAIIMARELLTEAKNELEGKK